MKAQNTLAEAEVQLFFAAGTLKAAETILRAEMAKDAHGTTVEMPMMAMDALVAFLEKRRTQLCESVNSAAGQFSSEVAEVMRFDQSEGASAMIDHLAATSSYASTDSARRAISLFVDELRGLIFFVMANRSDHLRTEADRPAPEEDEEE